jgi:hypothetical protein
MKFLAPRRPSASTPDEYARSAASRESMNEGEPRCATHLGLIKIAVAEHVWAGVYANHPILIIIKRVWSSPEMARPR